MKVVRDAIWLVCATVVLSACEGRGSGDAHDMRVPKDVHVQVTHLHKFDDQCVADLKTPGFGQQNGQACNGVPGANGLACGQWGDTIVWMSPGNDTLTNISFKDGLQSVCEGGGVKHANSTLRCKLQDPGVEWAVHEYKLEYTSNKDGACSVDPFIIVTRH